MLEQCFERLKLFDHWKMTISLSIYTECDIKCTRELADVIW